MILDDKGKLFGKINVIDFIIIVFLISLTPMFYFGYKMFNQPPAPPPPPPVSPPPVVINYAPSFVEIYCDFIDVDRKIADLITSGDIEVDKDGKKIAEILSVIDKIEYVSKFDLGRGVTAELKDGDKVRMLVKMKVLPVIKGGSILYKGVTISLGSTINFNSKEYEVKGLTFAPQRRLQLKVAYNNLLSSRAEIVRKGDVEVGSNGRVKGEIGEVLKNVPAKNRPFSQKLDNYKFVNYPDHRDLELSFIVSAEGRKDGFYYNGGKLSVGKGFSFQSENYYLSGTIVGMEQLELKGFK